MPWARLDFTNVDKTQAYIKRSKSFPLEVTIFKNKEESSLEDAFLLAIPHIKRFKTLAIVGTSDLPNLTRHLTLPTPSLKELTIDFNCNPTPVLDNILVNLDLSSLCTLSLGGIITRLPWKNLWNLTTFKLRCPPDNTITVMQLLNFFESTPHLRDITLRDSVPTSSNAPSSRVVHLLHLKNLTIFGNPAHGILLNHLSIPDGASLVLDFDFRGDKSPFPACLPRTNKYLKNLFRVTAVNLCFDGGTRFVRLDGPSGTLYMFGHFVSFPQKSSLYLNPRILQSLDYFSLHITRSLVIAEYRALMPLQTNESPSSCILFRMKDLRTLTLTRCDNLPFIFALNPGCNPSEIIHCPKLEELTLYVEEWGALDLPEVVRMAEERESRGAKLRLVKIVGLGELLLRREVFELRKYVMHVEYRFEENPPKWDSVPDYESD